MVLVAGHLGANITHGEKFLLAPLLSDDRPPLVALDDALVYAHVVQPILEEKCVSCHNPQKAKGELIMTTTELFAKGRQEWHTLGHHQSRSRFASKSGAFAARRQEAHAPARQGATVR